MNYCLTGIIKLLTSFKGIIVLVIMYSVGSYLVSDIEHIGIGGIVKFLVIVVIILNLRGRVKV